jgi:polysaccharide export outer membrane protein
MRCIAISLLAVALAGPVLAQQQSDLSQTSSGASDTSGNSIAERLGAGDLISVVVYDSAEFSHNYHIDDDGTIRLPMVRQRIHVAGLTQDECESAIATALVNEQVLVSPMVTVTIAEYHSHPITVMGAVKSPVTFQAVGRVTLFDAMMRAGGLADNAGADLLLTHAPSSAGGTSIGLTDRIPLISLQDVAGPEANRVLEGGDIIRVPDAGQIYIVGNVNHPGPFVVTHSPDMSILRALSIAGGLSPYASHIGYIYRVDVNGAHKNEIPVNIHKILKRQSPDLPLFANDMLYIPNRSFLQASAKTLEVSAAALGVLAFLIYEVH